VTSALPSCLAPGPKSWCCGSGLGSKPGSREGSAVPSGDAWSRCPRPRRAEARRQLGPPLSCRSADLGGSSPGLPADRSPSLAWYLATVSAGDSTVTPGSPGGAEAPPGRPDAAADQSHDLDESVLGSTAAPKRHGRSGMFPSLPRTTFRTPGFAGLLAEASGPGSPCSFTSRSVDYPCRAPTFPSIFRLPRNSCRQRTFGLSGRLLRRTAEHRSASPPTGGRPVCLSTLLARFRPVPGAEASWSVRPWPASLGLRTVASPVAPHRSAKRQDACSCSTVSRRTLCGMAALTAGGQARWPHGDNPCHATPPATSRPCHGPAALACSGCRDGGSRCQSRDPAGRPSLPASRSSPSVPRFREASWGSGPVLVLAGPRHRSVADLAGRAEAPPAT
jgi:hypothetical protein